MRVTVGKESDVARDFGSGQWWRRILHLIRTVANLQRNDVGSGNITEFGILPIILEVPDCVFVYNVDLAIELEKLFYFIR